jgi:alpha-N-acetylglucosamine transferase
VSTRGRLYKRLSSLKNLDSVNRLERVSEAPVMPGSPMTGRAYVTLVTSADFAVGASALVRSLKLSGTDADIVVMFTAGVPEASLVRLRTRGARLFPVDLLPTSDAFNEAHAKDRLHVAAPFTKGEKPPFHTPLDNFAKLRLWQLDYERVVFLDADTLVLRNVDRLFEYPEFSAAPNVYESLGDFHRMNSGVFTARPSEETFAAMLERLDAPGAFWRRTDQTFLQSFFPDWHGLPVMDNMLQYVWTNLPELWDWGGIRILHYQYEKPWQDHAKADALGPLIELWRAYAGDGPVPDLGGLPLPLPR